MSMRVCVHVTESRGVRRQPSSIGCNDQRETGTVDNPD
jgi:hypothetical protein